MQTEEITILIMRILLIFGIVLNAVLLTIHAKKQMRTEAGKAEFWKSKKLAPYNFLVGFIANFCDIMGIGSFSVASALIKLRKSIDDINIPGSLNVGFTISTCIQGLLFIGSIQVDTTTLVVQLGAAVLGSYLGARVVTRLNRTAIRFAMFAGLLIVGSVMVCKKLEIGPFGITGAATGLDGINLVVAAGLSMIFGALMNVGVGIYAPMMALVLLFGMDATIAYPIMSGASAYLMAFGCGPKFIKEGRIDTLTTIVFTIAGAAGALVCYFTVFRVLANNLNILIWVVIGVIYITAGMFLKDAIADIKNRER